jgi:hypothetical protein
MSSAERKENDPTPARLSEASIEQHMDIAIAVESDRDFA